MEKAKLVAAALVTIAGALFFFRTAIQSLIYPPEPPEKSLTTPITATPTPSQAPDQTLNQNPSDQYPVRLVIPKIHVNAAIRPAGINVLGQMSVPRSYTDVGWYKYGTLPGEIGSAVIAGHVNSGLGLDAVFTRLKELVPGDDIYVRAANGKELHFVVSTAETYPYKNVPGNAVFAAADAPRLNLITCDGAWVDNHTTYDHRLVVYSVLKN